MPDEEGDGEHAPGRLPDNRPLAVIDIGSNSVRLVVYEGLKRNPVPLFNEKVLCGLGEQIASTGRLPEAAVERAALALRRFRALADLMKVASLNVVATAAVREAANGPIFVEEVEAICRAEVEILSGPREAELAALGVVSGTWKPDGLAGDLGGGSLELVDVLGQDVGNGLTLPLGGLRLQDVSGKSVKRAAAIVKEALDECRLLEKGKDRSFYAVGGTWRALGRLHMFQHDYPLHVMHGYEIEAEEALDFARLVSRGAPSEFPAIEAVSEARRPLLAYGALVLEHFIRRAKPARIVFSAVGLREGLLHSLLDAEERAADPLIAAAAELAFLRARSPAHAEELYRWTGALFDAAGLEEAPQEHRLRRVACLLSDIGWRAHPDYRGEHSLNTISHAPFVGLTHAERAFLALSVFYRHVGLVGESETPRIRELCTPRLLERARMLGAAFRVASALTASMSGVIDRAPLRVADGKLTLVLGGDLAALSGRRVQNRLRTLGKLLDLEATIAG